MRLTFGLSFDRSAALPSGIAEQGADYVGPLRFLDLFEGYLGLPRYTEELDYLRIEQFRQLLQADVSVFPDSFYADSFHADPFAVAAELLSRRDELWMAGWDFQLDADTPARLRVLQRIRFDPHAHLPGMADRFVRVYEALASRIHPIVRLNVLEPKEWLPPAWVRMFERLRTGGVVVEYGRLPESGAAPDSDLGKFQELLRKGSGGNKMELRADGSLLLIEGKSDSDLAAFTAAWLRLQSKQLPAFLLQGASRLLDDALVREGLPSLGLQTVSLARPALQVLKLVPTFLWEPLDLYKALEFVSLALKPMDEELASRIALQMAQTPGVFSDSWQQMLGKYFRELEDAGRPIQEARASYQFWFERARFDSNGMAPKSEALALFRFVSAWAEGLVRQGEGNTSLGILNIQARRIVELLEALPEQQLSRLQLERIVRTIFEPAPLQLRPQEAGSGQVIQQPGAVYPSVPALIWWNFSQAEPDYFFSRWSKHERSWLYSKGVSLDTPDLQNQRVVWQRAQPVWRTTHQLCLLIPKVVEGKEVQAHPLLGDLEAGFSNLSCIRCRLEEGLELRHPWPTYAPLASRVLGQPPVFIHAPANIKLQVRDTETFSSLESLLYFPYKWVFQYQLKLRKSPILGIVDERTLSGNLAHRMFELLLAQADVHRWQAADIEAFIDEISGELLAKEGAILLLYGREPERVRLIRRVKKAAVVFVTMLQQNGWRILATEHSLEGTLGRLQLKARADLVLERADELAVIDLKWGGATFRHGLIRSESDLQLALYALLLNQPERVVHTGYFILEQAKMLARNKKAFQEVHPIAPDVDHQAVLERIVRRMEATLRWRMDQLEAGQIEVRCKQTQQALEAHYAEENLLELLELYQHESPFDDYRILINRLTN